MVTGARVSDASGPDGPGARYKLVLYHGAAISLRDPVLTLTRAPVWARFYFSFSNQISSVSTRLLVYSLAG